MLIFGSCAMKHWYPDSRIPNDFEVISPENYWVNSFQYILDNNINGQYVDPDFLYTIKVSHAAWDIHWDKTMHDVVFLKEKGCILDEILYNMLYQEWEVLHGKKNVKLNVKNEDFFTDKITRKYDHDWLHEQLCFYDRPLHEKIRYDLTSPICSEKLFANLSYDDKIKCALEEVYVIGTERFVLNGKSYNEAKYKTLKLLITSMTSGWFNRFIIENFKILIYSENLTWQKKYQILSQKNI